MDEHGPWAARLTAGPFDGVTVRLDLIEGELPHALVVALAVGDIASHLVWHSYVLDGGGSSFRYLGEDPIVGDDGPGLGVVLASEDVPEAVATGEELTRRFYDLLFERHSSLRPLFPTDMRAQPAMLRRTVEAVLQHFDDPAWLSTTLGKLGARHARLGITESMYADFCECMLSAMAEVAGSQWTPQRQADWRETLAEISELMMAGARRAP